MATILFEGTEFKIASDLAAGSVLGAACVRFGDPGDYYRFRLFDEQGREVQPGEMVGKRRLALCDVRKLRDFAEPKAQDLRIAFSTK